MLVIRWPRREGCQLIRLEITARTARTDLLAGSADGLIIFVQDNTDLVHEADLLLIVTFELRGAGGIDVGEEAEDRLGSNCRGLRRLGHGRGC